MRTFDSLCTSVARVRYVVLIALLLLGVSPRLGRAVPVFREVWFHLDTLSAVYDRDPNRPDTDDQDVYTKDLPYYSSESVFVESGGLQNIIVDVYGFAQRRDRVTFDTYVLGACSSPISIRQVVQNYFPLDRSYYFLGGTYSFLPRFGLSAANQPDFWLLAAETLSDVPCANLSDPSGLGYLVVPPYDVRVTFQDDVTCPGDPVSVGIEFNSTLPLVITTPVVDVGGEIQATCVVDSAVATIRCGTTSTQRVASVTLISSIPIAGTPYSSYTYRWKATGLPVNTGENYIQTKVTTAGGGSGLSKRITFFGHKRPRSSSDDKKDVCSDCPKRVNLATGAVDWDPPDISIPGGTPLSLSRFYHSDGAWDGPFGRGWTHNYNIQAIRVKDATTNTYARIVRWGNGRRVKFLENGDGTFTNPPGWYLAASQSGDNRLIISSPDNTIYTFDIQGFVTSIQSKTHNVARQPTLTFEYGAGHRLHRVSSDSASSLTFAYGTGKITTISASTGQSVSYHYSADGRQLLQKFVDAESSPTTYAYDPDTGRLTSVTDGEDRPVMAVVYDGLGRAVSYTMDGSTRTYEYDPENRITTVRNEKNDASVYTWDDNHQFRQLNDAAGNTSFSDINANLDVTRTQNALGHSTRFSHSASGIVTSVTATDGTSTHVSVTTVAGVERPVSIRFPSGNSSSITYDPSTGVPQSIRARDGKVSLLTSDDAGRLTSVRGPTGRIATVAYDPLLGLPASMSSTPNDGGPVATTQISYDSRRHPQSVIDPLGNQTRLETDSRGLVTRVTDARSGETTITYDAAKHPTTVTDARQLTSSMTWDGAGRLTKSTNALDQVLQLSYEMEQLKSVTNHRGESVSRTFDALRRLSSTTDPAGGVTQFSYDSAGRVIGVIDPNTNPTVLKYDVLDRIEMITRPGPEQHSISMSYYPDGELKSVKDEIGRLTTFSIDASGRTTGVTVAGTPPTITGYDDDGRVTSVTDPLRRTIRYGYDGLGRMNGLTLADGTKYKLVRDVGGRITDIDKTQADESGAPKRWHFDYDALHRLIKRTDPLGNFTEIAYDAVGNVTKLDEPGEGGARLVTAFPSYDAINRPTQIVRPDETVDIAYNDQRDGNGLHGMVMTITRPGRSNVTVVRRFDALERLVDYQVGDSTTSYQYDGNSNVTDVFLTTPAAGRAKILHYELDARNRVTSVQDVRANRTVSLTWDAASQLTKVTYPSGITKDITPGPRGETTDIVYKTGAGSVIRALHYVYDDALQLKRRDDTVGVNPVKSTSFEYNLRGELTSVNYPDGTGERFTHDAAGNIVEYDKLTAAGILSELRFHDAADQLYNISGSRQVSLTHDPRGNVTQILDVTAKVTTTFSWDAAGRLVSTSATTKSTPAGVLTTSTVGLEFADDYRLTLFKDGDSPAVQPVWGMDNMLAEITTGGAGEQFTLHLPELDSPIERGPPNNAAERQTLLTDHLMSAIAAYDDAGEVIPGSETEYLAYGGVKSGDPSRPIGFHGARRLGSTGLYYLRNRIYSPELGRFLSRDPIGFEGGLNLYSYVSNNPISMSDPLGLLSVSETAWAFAKGVGQGVVGAAAMASLAVGATAASPFIAIGSAVTAVGLAAYGGYGAGRTVYAIATRRDPSTGRAISPQQQANAAAQLIGGIIGGGSTGRALSRFIEGEALSSALQLNAEFVTNLRSVGLSPAAAVGAFDAETGAMVAAMSGNLPPEIHPLLAELASRIGRLGERTASGNPLGMCAEFHGGNDLLLLGSLLRNIRFTPAIRPRTGQVIPPCENCTEMFGPNLNPGTNWRAVGAGAAGGAAGGTVGNIRTNP